MTRTTFSYAPQCGPAIVRFSLPSYPELLIESPRRLVSDLNLDPTSCSRPDPCLADNDLLWLCKSLSSAAAQVEVRPLPDVRKMAERPPDWEWYLEDLARYLLRIEIPAAFNCSYCGAALIGPLSVPSEMPLNVSGVFIVPMAGGSVACRDCCGEIVWRTEHRFTRPRRLGAELKGNTPDDFTARFQDHQFGSRRVFKRIAPDNVTFSNDYEHKQREAAEPQQGCCVAQEAVHNDLPKKARDCKLAMDRSAAGLGRAATLKTVEFEGSFNQASHLEIGFVSATHGRRFEIVSLPCPDKCTRPPNKCAHGCWRKQSCGLCNPVGIPVDGADWFGRVDISFLADNTCALCGCKLENWRRDYCTECARQVVLMTTIEVSIERPNMEGRAATYQEKIVRRGNRQIPPVTFGEVRLYARSIVGLELDDLAGRDLVIPEEVYRWAYRNLTWFQKLLDRFWLYTHGATLQQIAECENVKPHSIHKYLDEHSVLIRKIFDGLGASS